MMRASTSRPSWSVPSQLSAVGPFIRCTITCAMGSCRREQRREDGQQHLQRHEDDGEGQQLVAAHRRRSFGATRGSMTA